MKRDWRIGLTVKPKARTHPRYYESCKVVEVLPDGTAGMFDKDGILKIKSSTGEVFLARADEWRTG